MNESAEAIVTRSPVLYPYRKELVMIAKKKPKKKMLFVPLLSATSTVYEATSAQYDQARMRCVNSFERHTRPQMIAL